MVVTSRKAGSIQLLNNIGIVCLLCMISVYYFHLSKAVNLDYISSFADKETYIGRASYRMSRFKKAFRTFGQEKANETNIQSKRIRIRVATFAGRSELS